MKAPSRNSVCSCGSGKRYKHCHGRLAPGESDLPPWITDSLNARLAARAKQRQAQQGLGRPIISVEHEGIRYVQVGDTVCYSKGWRTFTNFLRQYVFIALGRVWFADELAKTNPDRHPMMCWFDRAGVHDAAIAEETKGEFKLMAGTGAIMAILHLAYDLYSLAHNLELQKKLIERLKNSDQFHGARYEIFVAASLIRAGYHVEFEDENDRSHTHCEFSARSPSGKMYSVEAKRRQHHHGAKPRLRLGKLLSKALAKVAQHERIVFIETNVPDHGATAKNIEFYRNAIRDLRRFQGKRQTTPAYLVVTNTPFEHHADATDVATSLCVDGFGIADFGFDFKPATFSAGYVAKQRHRDMHDLAYSLNRDRTIPATFDGDIPEIAYGDQTQRLTFGNTYLVADDNGREVSALLVDGAVMPSARCAYCIYQIPDGSFIVHTVPLTDAELRAHNAHPDTFFGVIRPVIKLGQTSTEMFESLLSTYLRSSKEKLIELLFASGDHDLLTSLPQEELAMRYAEVCLQRIIREREQTLAQRRDSSAR